MTEEPMEVHMRHSLAAMVFSVLFAFGCTPAAPAEETTPGSGGTGGKAGSGGSGSGGARTGGTSAGGSTGNGGSGSGGISGGGGSPGTGGVRTGGTSGGTGGTSGGGSGGTQGATDAATSNDGLKENELPTWDNLKNYFIAGCVFCHPGETAVQKNSDFSESDPKKLHSVLISEMPTQYIPAGCALKRLVVPGKPMESLLYVKLLSPVPANCGARMPADKPQGPDEFTLKGIRRWIEAGAPGPTP